MSRNLSPGETVVIERGLTKLPDVSPVFSVYAGPTLLGSAAVQVELGETHLYKATFTLPNTGLSDGDVITMRANAVVDGEPLPTLPIDVGVIKSDDAQIIAAAVVASLAGVTVTINTPLVSDDDGETLTVEQGDNYSTRPLRIEIDSAEDLTAHKYVLAARMPSNPVNVIAVRMTIKQDGQGQYAEFAPSAIVTSSWATGTYDLRHRIETGPDEYETIDRPGRLIVLPFDTPSNIVDVDP